MKTWFSYTLCSFLLFSLTASASQDTSEHGMVVSEQALASKTGLAVLQSGGNAIDAAVAVGYALAVVSPCCGNLGGGGFMTIHLADGRNTFINFREKAPLAAHADMFLDAKGNPISAKSTKGYLAVATPGTVMGFDLALNHYGTLPRQELLKYVINYAKDGFILTPGDVKILRMDTKNFQTQPNVAAIFLKHNQPLQAGDKLIQKDLAQTLQLISQDGPAAFYRGQIAKTIVHASKENGGILTLKDFAAYRAQELSPVQCHYRGYTIISAPPPSSGGTTLCEMLAILEKYPLNKMGYHSAQAIYYLVEAMRFAYADRNNLLGDPDFVSNPVAQLISKKHAEKIQQQIDQTHAIQFPTTSKEGADTSHYSVIDKWGNAVSVTYTINNFFGAHVIAGNTGFFLNDEMDDFSVKPGLKNQFGLIQGEKNRIQPGKRPLSSMTPTIVLKNNQVVLILGSPGGPRITTSVLLTLINLIDYGMTIEDAVNTPRFHHQSLPDFIDLEPNALPVSVTTKLAARGYRFKLHVPWGAVEAIYIDPATGHIIGVNDKRRPAGAAVGY